MSIADYVYQADDHADIWLIISRKQSYIAKNWTFMQSYCANLPIQWTMNPVPSYEQNACSCQHTVYRSCSRKQSYIANNWTLPHSYFHKTFFVLVVRVFQCNEPWTWSQVLGRMHGVAKAKSTDLEVIAWAEGARQWYTIHCHDKQFQWSWYSWVGWCHGPKGLFRWCPWIRLWGKNKINICCIQFLRFGQALSTVPIAARTSQTCVWKHMWCVWWRCHFSFEVQASTKQKKGWQWQDVLCCSWRRPVQFC